MRKIVLLLAIFFTSSLLAVEKVQFPASFANGWEPYIGKMVQITTPLYVCGNYYDSLILAPVLRSHACHYSLALCIAKYTQNSKRLLTENIH